MKSLLPRLGVPTLFLSLVTFGASTLAPAPAALAQPAAETVTEEGVIKGEMNIDFQTRTKLDTTGDLKKGSSALNVSDIYRFNISVAKTTEYNGEIKRQPNLYSSVLARKKQDAKLAFKIDLSVLNPSDLKQKKTVGNWVGEVPIDSASGAFDLGGGGALKDPSPLRIDVQAIGKQAAFKDMFGGRLVGKAENKEGLASYTYKRLIGNKEVAVVVKKSDPMRFENIILAKGPTESYPRATVNGRLDYDYETGNWFTDGIRIVYNHDGKEITDIVTGSIKWVEDANRTSNGKGYYDFNLRFNEEKNKKASTEGDAFGKMSDEEAFFAVDNSIPCLTGRIEYTDSMVPNPAGGDPVPGSSKVVYALNANKLTKQQIVHFFKLWMIAVGPTNDE
jgi:hypothetical protein